VLRFKSQWEFSAPITHYFFCVTSTIVLNPKGKFQNVFREKTCIALIFLFQIPKGKSQNSTFVAPGIERSFRFQIPKGMSNTKIANKFARKSASFKFQRKK